MLYNETPIAQVKCGESVVPGLGLIQHFAQLPQLVLPEGEQHFHSGNTAHCPPTLDRVVLGVFGDLNNVHLNKGVLDVPYGPQESDLFQEGINTSAMEKNIPLDHSTL